MAMAVRKPPVTNTALVSAPQTALAQTLDEDAGRRFQERSTAGKYLAKVQPEQWDWVLEEIRSGNTEANIVRTMNEYGMDVSHGIIAAKRRIDTDFAAAYWAALEDAFITIAQETLEIADGDDPNATGDVQRDRLRVETRLKLASKFARKIMGEKVEIEQKSLVININPDDPQIV